MSHTPDNFSAPDFLAPLRKWTRSDIVTAQLTELSRPSRSAVLRRAAETAPALRLRWETLVALTRGFLRAGDQNSADELFVLLAARMGGAIRGEIAGWSALSQDEKDDAADQMIALLCECVYDLSAAAEFWECNLTTCLERRMATLWRRLTEKKIVTVSSVTPTEGGEDWDRFAQIAGPEDTFADVEAADLLETVSGGDPQRRGMLHLRMSGFSDEDIARQLNVTTRTLRNWTHELRAAHTRQTGPGT